MNASCHPDAAARSAADRVSVVLIVRNGAATIAEALASVLRSPTQPLEVLVIDGNSSDDTVAIASRFPRVTVVPEESPGIANAYNQGIALARGDLVAFISHDDLWTDGKLDRQLAVMQAQPELLFTVGMVEHFLAGDRPPPGFRRELLAGPCPGFIMETLMARQAAFDVVGHFDPSFRVSEDTDWFARARDAGVAMALLPEVLVRKRVHGDNASLNTANINQLLLRALRGSVARKRTLACAETGR
jgi:glycosyltransferase involved in cell wall biosynthesis